MTSSRPYLVRALVEWILDNELTPYLVIQCDIDGVDVPPEHVKDGKIVLNVSPNATRHFVVGQDAVQFDSRFNGVSRTIAAPIGAVVAVYARENGAGMGFEPEAPVPPTSDDSDPPPKGGGPNLRIV